MTVLAGSNVLVTGAARGLGHQLALQASRRGARIVAWDLDGPGLDALAGELGGSLLSASVVDVTDRDSVAAGVDAIPGGAGAVDVVVNNAGVVSGARLVDLRPEQIERTFAVNVLALYWVTKAFLPAMLERDRGHVVTLASAAGLVGVARQTDYSASKHAAVGFMESLRAELRRDGAHVGTTTVCPFYIDTGMFEGARTKLPWLLPILREPDVAAKILRAVERDRAMLRLPPVVGTIAVGRILPTPLFDRLMDLMGVNQSMDEFVGRARGARSDRGAGTGGAGTATGGNGDGADNGDDVSARR
jgi:all-trans-retinol dehydrogenase (NAD+)